MKIIQIIKWSASLVNLLNYICVFCGNFIYSFIYSSNIYLHIISITQFINSLLIIMSLQQTTAPQGEKPHISYSHLQSEDLDTADAQKIFIKCRHAQLDELSTYYMSSFVLSTGYPKLTKTRPLPPRFKYSNGTQRERNKP